MRCENGRDDFAAFFMCAIAWHCGILRRFTQRLHFALKMHGISMILPLAQHSLTGDNGRAVCFALLRTLETE
jgi:hypothetical protein